MEQSGFDAFVARETTRRALLRRAGAAVISLGAASPLIAACGGVAGQTSSGGGGGAQGRIGGPVDFLAWEGYDLPGPTKAWRRAHHVTFRSTYIGTHDDIQAKLKSGASTSYDLITYYQGFYDLYKKLDIITPLDESKIPNLKGVDPFFKTSDTAKRFWVVDGKRYAVPFTWGSTTLDYLPDKIDPPESWLDLLKPKFKGKVGWVPDASGAFTLGGRILGFDVPNYTKSQFQEIAKLLRRFRAQTRSFAPSFGDLTNQFVGGEVVASFAGWAAVGSFAKAKDVTVKSIVPKEGSYSFCDSFAIPPTTDNRDTVLGWINDALAPKVQAESADSLSAGVVVPAAAPLLSKDTRAIYPDAYEGNMAGHFTKVPLYGFPPTDGAGGIVTRDQWLKEWSAIQAGH